MKGINEPLGWLLHPGSKYFGSITIFYDYGFETT
jgi:hypothetical protein